ncbi:MAG: hypothetical protein DMF89_01990 [Acidobacteria bacterium]|nr:MAG: hypothetical protein DMF89_01990 [Acidobacteriota bacterium]
MRGLRSTLALLVILIGLGAYIYFVTSKRSDDRGPKQEKLFTSVEADKVEELKIKSATGDRTTLKKEGGTWKIVEPIAAAASQPDASAVVNAVADTEIVRVVDDNPGDVKEYGLDAPRIEVEFTSSGGKPSGRLLVGDKTTTGGNLYARRNDEKRVVLIAQYQESTLNKSTFDLRDKAVVKFDRDKVTGVEVTADGKTLEFAKSGSDWRMTRPLDARADFSAVEGLIGRLESAQMKSIVPGEPSSSDLKKYGLDKPSVSASIRLGSARATVLLGGKSDAGVYARDGSRPDVMTVDNSVADDLKKAADDYRKKDVFDFRAFNATKVELTPPRRSISPGTSRPSCSSGSRDRAKHPTSGGASAPTPATPTRGRSRRSWLASRT